MDIVFGLYMRKTHYLSTNKCWVCLVGSVNIPKEENILFVCVSVDSTKNGEGSLFSETVTLNNITESQNGRGWKGPLWVI